MSNQPSVRRWERVEVELRHPQPPNDPYRDVALRVELRNPFGDKTAIEGFHDGGDRWRFRFAPEAPGRWRYRAAFSDGAAETSGQFFCGHGDGQPPIGIHPANPIWFKRGVEPFLVRALHVGDRFFAANWPEPHRRQFLDWCQARGYNTLSVASFLLNRQSEGRGLGWETPALWPLDPDAFAQAETILDDLAERGIVVFPFAGFLGRDAVAPTDPDEQDLFLRYVLARWAWYPNLLFNVAGPEPLLAKNPFLQPEDVERIGRRIRRLDPYGRPLTVHNPTGDDAFHDADWTTFGTLQGPKTVDREELRRGLGRNLHPAKPLFAQETLWSGNQYHQRQIGREYTDRDIRLNALTILFCGAQFCFADNQGDSSSGFSGSLDLADCAEPRHEIVRAVWDWFETTPYFEMRPDPALAGGRPCLVRPGRRYLVLLEDGGTVDVDTAGRPMAVRWIDVATLSDARDGGYTTDGRGLTAPSDAEWILDLRADGTGLAEQIHLAAQADPAAGVAVAWHTALPQDAPAVHLAEAGRPGSQTVRPARSSPAPGEGYLHVARLDALQPATEYRYSVTHDAGVPAGSTDPIPFRTPPAEPGRPLRLAFFCDTGLMGRLDGNVDGARAVRDHLIEDRPDLLLGAGDWAYANRDRRFSRVADAVDEWFRQWQPLLSRVPLATQFGNHEIVLEERYEDWAPRLPQAAGADEGRCFSMSVAGVHLAAMFAAHESHYQGDRAGATDAWLRWLDDDLAAARQRGVQWLIVYQHLPIFGHGTSHPAAPEVGPAIAPILERHRVDLHLSGHDQNFERTFPLLDVAQTPRITAHHAGPYRQGAGVIYAKVSPAGKRSEIGNQFSRLPDPTPPVIAAAHDRAHHYALIDLEADALRVTVYGLENHDAPREVIDTFEIQRRPTE